MLPPIAIVKGEGAILIDENGNSYIDAISSWWVNLHGHAHPYIAKKIYEQALKLEQVIFAGFTHEPAVALAERLIGILPKGFSKIFYSDNGSTSTEVALKMAIQYWRNKGNHSRKKILALRDSYHGDTFGAMSVSERSVFTLAFHDLLFEVIFIDPSRSLDDFDCSDAICFIYEPLVQGAGGMKMYSADWLETALKLFKSREVICIADEVMTGFGRTGKTFASEYINASPDIICLSKGLTGGTMALGVTACTEKIYNAFVDDDKLKTFFHGHSFTANPIACTAALSSLDLLLTDECADNIRRIIRQHEKFISQLKSFASSNPFIKNIRQQGTIIACEISSGKDEYLNSIGAAVTKKCLNHGVYLRPLGNTVYMMPPYCITNEQLEKVYGVLMKVLEGLLVTAE